MQYEIYYEDELTATFEDWDGVLAFLREERKSYLEDLEECCATYPELYNPDDKNGVDEYLADVYSIKIPLDFPEL